MSSDVLMYINKPVMDSIFAFKLTTPKTYNLQVEFAGEDGSDTGGLRREFFCLLTKGVAGAYLNATGAFQHNSVALQVQAHSCTVWCTCPESPRHNVYILY